MYIKMKIIPVSVISIFLIIASCYNGKQKLRVDALGYLKLGIKASEENDLFDSLVISKTYFINPLGRPFFNMQIRDILGSNELTIFTFVQMNDDSIVTRLHYYPFVYRRFNDLGGLTKEQEMSILKQANREYDFHVKVVNEFTLKNVPSVGNNVSTIPDNSPVSDAFKLLSQELEKKYGTAVNESSGDIYDPKDRNSKEVLVWHLKLIDIRLIHKKHPQRDYNGQFGNYQTILIYEFNKEALKAYSLETKRKEIGDTF